jgi:hypothetical protein
MAEQTIKSSSNRPEALRNRHVNGKQTTYAFPSKPLPHGIQFIFKDYDYGAFVNSITANLGLNPTLQGKPVPKDLVSIELPFPRTLSDSTNVNVSSFERDFLTERIVSGIGSLMEDGSITGIIDKIAEVSSMALNGVRNIGSGEAGIEGKLKEILGSLNVGDVSAGSKYLARSYLPGNASTQADALVGQVVNPQSTLSFSGVALKNYSFSWDLFPANQSDSIQLQQIIRTLKNKALPKVGAVAGVESLNRAYLKYPSVVIVNLLGVDETHFVRFKPAMLTNVTVDYGGSGAISILKGGKPSALTLRLDFSELTIHTAEDYELSGGDEV